MNIVKELQKALRNKAEYITQEGDFLTLQEVEQEIKRKYIDGLENDLIDFSLSYNCFFQMEVSMYIPISLFIETLNEHFNIRLENYDYTEKFSYESIQAI